MLRHPLGDCTRYEIVERRLAAHARNRCREAQVREILPQGFVLCANCCELTLQRSEVRIGIRNSPRHLLARAQEEETDSGNGGSNGSAGEKERESFQGLQAFVWVAV